MKKRSFLHLRGHTEEEEEEEEGGGR